MGVKICIFDIEEFVPDRSISHYSRDQRFLSFAKNMGKNIGKNIGKNLSGKYSPKPLDHAKKSATDALKTSSKTVIIQKRAEVTGDLIGNKIDDKITKVSNISQQNYSETNTNWDNKEIPKKRWISLEKRKKEIIDKVK